jgi:class 3 adenylate cyclase
MRWMLLCIFSFSFHSGFAQPDSLLEMSFSDRYLALKKAFPRIENDQDSIEMVENLETLEAFAKKHHQNRMLLELRCLKLFRLSDKNDANTDMVVSGFKQLIKDAESEDFPHIQALCYFALGEFYWERKNEISKSIQSYEAAYNLAKEIPDNDFFEKKEIYYKLGERYFYLNDFPTARKFFMEAQSIENPWDPLHPNIRLNNTLGLTYLIQGNLDEAEKCFHLALEYAEKANAKVWIGTLNGNLGGIQIKRGNLDEGIKLLRIDERISLERGSKASASGALIEIARLSLKKGDVESASRQLDSAIMLVNNNISFPKKKAVYPLMSEIARAKGEWEKAALYMDSTVLVQDSIFSKDKSLRQLRLDQRLELEASKTEIAKTEAENRRKTFQMYGLIAVLLLALGAGGLILRQKRKTDEARKLSDKLLLNILPENVAAELKESGKSAARKFPEVTVLFSDFKGFTTYSENMPADELVAILDDYFKAFDNIISECGLEKIKTIGDAYMCVGGMPSSDPEHAQKIVKAALQMQQVMKEKSAGWQLRIGIHTGPVVAGIVGTKKFAYDIWGDTVNTAARMEQNSEPGRINISQSTFEKIKEHFNCTYRGKIQAKNKGELDMYFVEEG